MMTTQYHACLSIKGALENAKDFVGCIEDENGNLFDGTNEGTKQ